MQYGHFYEMNMCIACAPILSSQVLDAQLAGVCLPEIDYENGTALAVGICIHIYIYVYIKKYTRIYVYIYKYMNEYVHISIRVYVYMYTYTYGKRSAIFIIYFGQTNACQLCIQHL